MCGGCRWRHPPHPFGAHANAGWASVEPSAGFEPASTRFASAAVSCSGHRNINRAVACCGGEACAGTRRGGVDRQHAAGLRCLDPSRLREVRHVIAEAGIKARQVNWLACPLARTGGEFSSWSGARTCFFGGALTVRGVYRFRLPGRDANCLAMVGYRFLDSVWSRTPR